jgi:phage gpG-like protein
MRFSRHFPSVIFLLVLRPRFLVALGALLLLQGAASAQSNLVSLISQPGDYIGQGQTYFTTNAADFSFSGTSNSISVKAFGYTIVLDGPGSAALGLGQYPVATRWPFNGSNPGLDISGNGRGCNSVCGSFEILEMHADALGEIDRFRATFTQRCECTVAELNGEIRFVRSPSLPAVTNSVSLISQAGDYIGQGQAYFSTNAADFSVSGTPYTVSVAAFGYSITMDAPGSTMLDAGVYPGASRWPFNGSTPGLSIAGNGRGCNTLSGAFNILEFRTNNLGQVDRFWATFAQHCESAIPAMIGEVRFVAPASSNASLASLSVAAGAISPSFAQNTLAYQLTVAEGVSSTTITPTAAGPWASIIVNGTSVVTGTASSPVNLAYGSNFVAIAVTAEDGTGKSYSLVINRLVSPPSITVQPTNLTVLVGTNVTLAAVATGTAPLSYQWQSNGVSMAGATNTTLLFSNVQTNATAIYSVVVTNSVGSVTSSNAVLTVNAPPIITAQPVSQSVMAGSNVTFTVAATGTAPLGYRWRFNGTNLADGGRVTGAMGSTLTVANLVINDAGSYDVVVTNVAGTVISSNAVLTVSAAPVAPSITTQPTNQTVLAGTNVTLAVIADGTGTLIYQWLSNGVALASATNTMLNFVNVQTNATAAYSVVITNSVGSVTSSIVALTVNALPVITTQPAGQSVVAGSDVIFTVVAGGTTPLNYQWRFNGTNLAGATAASYTRANVQTNHAGNYDVVVTNVAGTVTSSNAVLTVGAAPVAPSITMQPTNQTVLVGTNVTLAVVAGGTAPLSYQWQSNGVSVAGATNATLVFTNVQPNAAATYSVVITNNVGGVTSGNAVLTVNAPPVITTQPVSQSVAAGSDVTLTVAASGTAPLSYQWRFNGTNIGGATAASYTLTNALTNQAGTYGVVVSNAAGSVTSSNAVLAVTTGAVPMPAGLISWWAGDGHAFDGIGTNHGTLQGVTAYVAGLVGQAFAVIGSYVSIPTSPSLTFTSGTPYTLEAWVYRTNNSLPFHVLGKRDATSAYFYQMGYDGSDTPVPANVWTHLADTYDGATIRRYFNGTLVKSTASPPVTNAPTTAEFRIGFSGQLGGFSGLIDDVRIYSRPLAGTELQIIAASGTNGMVTPTNTPSITSQPATQTVFAGTPVSFTVQASSPFPLSYQWRLGGGNIAGATNATLAIASAQLGNAGDYSVVVSNAFDMVTSSNALLSVLAAPQITGQPLNQTVPAGSSAIFTVFATGTAPLSYQWRVNGIPLVGATNTTLSLASVGLANGGIYSVSVSNLVSVTTSTNVTLTVLSPPIITAGPQSQTVLSGTTVSLSITVLGTAPLTYQWSKDGVNIGGATGTNHTLTNLQTSQSGTYSVVVSNAYGSVTNAALITVTPGPLAPAIVTQPQSQTVRAGTNVTFTVLATGYPAPDYQWVKNGAAVSGVNAPSLLLTNVGLADAGSYYVQIFNASGVTNSAVATLTVQTLPSFTTQPQPAAVTPGNPAVFTVAVDGVPTPALSWFKDGVRLTNSASVSGATASTVLVFVTGTNQAGNYFAVATNAAGSSTSSVVALTVLLPPTITTHPTNVLLLRTNFGSVLPASFNVVAAGTAPLFYQWRFNGGDLSGATNPAFNLASVTRADNGFYTVVVSNTVGTATSSNALLRVRVPQRLAVPERLPDGRMRLVFLDDLGGMPGSNDMSYLEVQFATNLLATNVVWSRLTNAVTGTNGMLLLDEPPGMAGPRRFYRVIER